MDEDHAGHAPVRWLEIEGGAGEPRTVSCPRQGRVMPLRECLGCKQYRSLAIDPAGAHVYIDCTWGKPEPDADAPPV